MFMVENMSDRIYLTPRRKHYDCFLVAPVFRFIVVVFLFGKCMNDINGSFAGNIAAVFRALYLFRRG